MGKGWNAKIVNEMIGSVAGNYRDYRPQDVEPNSGFRADGLYWLSRVQTERILDMRKLDLPDEVKSGVVVGSVQKGMPADGKLQEYDVITEIDGKKISSKTDIQTNLYSHSIGDTIKVTFYRGKDKKTVDLKLTKSTEDISD